MSKGGGRSSRMQMQRRPASGSQPKVSDDPVMVGPDKSIHIDLSKVRAPANQYDADVSWIAHQPGKVSLFFGKIALDVDAADEKATRLRTRLELRYPPEAFVVHFWRNSRDFASRMRDYTQKWQGVIESPSHAARAWKAAKDHSEWANFEAMAHAGSEATIDFYQLPPSGIVRYTQGRGSAELIPQGIVRIQLTVFELSRLFDEAEGVVREIQKYAPLHLHEQRETEARIEE